MKWNPRALLLIIFGLLFVVSAYQVSETLLRARSEDAACTAIAQQAAAQRNAFAVTQAPAFR